MPVSDGFITYVLDQLSGLGEVSSRKMFGGAGLYSDGRMFGLIADDVAYLKTDDSNRGDFEKSGSPQFVPFPDKPKPMRMPYYEVPPDVLEDRDAFVQWATRSLAIPTRKK